MRYKVESKQVTSIIIIAVMFFVFGFVTWINSMLIPYFKIACELSNFQAYFVTFAFYISYLVVALPASFLIKRMGFKNGMMIGFWIMAAGAFLFIPAACLRVYGLFLGGLFLLGIGLALLQTAANPYVTILGPKQRAAQRISIMGICNKTAGILAPLILAAAILRPGDQALFKDIHLMTPALKNPLLDALIRRVILPYACMGSVLTLLGFMVRLSPLPEIDHFREENEAASTAVKRSILKYPHLILGAIAIFLHVGSQVIAVDTIIGYAQEGGMSMMEAKAFPSYTLFATICGYLMGIVLTPWLISQVNMFRCCSILGLLLSCLVLLSKGHVHFLGHYAAISIWFLVLLGVANSMIWSGIWPLALDRLDKQLKVGASILIMGLCGNAILPLIYGHLADKYSLKAGYIVLLPCYLYLIYYAFYGFKINKWKFSSSI